MGVLNVTPDSFSDGGRWLDPEAAIARGLALRDQGAAIVDVGGESTRPGSEPVDPAEEQRRVVPVIRELAAAGVMVSADTRRTETARAAVEAGARIVNDVAAGSDAGMLELVAAHDVDLVLMHARGESGDPTRYADVVGEVRDELLARRDAALAAGVAGERIVLDPGLGFSKGPAENWALLGATPAFVALGHRVLIGASRKRFLGALLPAEAGVEERDLPTAVVSALSAREGAWAVRVHDVPATVRALAVATAWGAPSAPDSAVDVLGPAVPGAAEGSRA